MATIQKDDYAAYNIKESRLRGLRILAGGNGKSSLAEADVVEHGFTTVLGCVATYSEAPATDEQLYCVLSTDGQVTFTDAGNNKDLTFILFGF